MSKQFAKLGWRTREPYSDWLPPQRPHLTEVITQTLLDKGFTLQEISTIAGFADSERNRMFRPAGPMLRAV